MSNINRRNEELILKKRQEQRTQQKLNKKIRNRLTIALAIGGTIYGGICCIDAYTIKDYKDRVYPNVYVDNIDVSNKTYSELSKIIKQQEDVLNNTLLVVKIGENEYSKKLSELSVRYNPVFTDLVFQTHKDLSVHKKAKIVKEKSENINFITEFRYEDEDIKNFIDEIYNSEKIIPTDPIITVNGNKVEVVDGIVGKEIDKYALLDAIKENLDKLTVGDNVQVSNTLKDVPFNDTKEELNKVNAKMGSYSTKLTSNTAMNNNIRLAVSKLNGTTIMSGETFSFINTIGPLTKENGYEEAIGFDSPDLEVGAGVCQLATTLYNSHILLGITPKTFENHSKPLSYVPIGQDVSIHGKNSDYKFTNTSAYPIHIKSYISGGRVTVEIWTNKNIINGRTYKMKKETSEDGLIVRTLLEMYENDKLVNKKNIKTSHYTK